MRHGDKIKNLSRTASHRKALLSNLASQLIEHKRITTTLAKAKSLRVYVEPILTRGKNDTMHNRRVVFSYLQDKESIKELFGVIGDKIANRPGGYTRIIKLPRRMGDAADMAMIELVDFNEIYKKDAKAGAAKKTRRSRRGGSASANAAGSGSIADNIQTPEATKAAAETAAADIAETEAPVVEESPAIDINPDVPATDGTENNA